MKLKNDGDPKKLADPQQDRAGNEQRHPARYASRDTPFGNEGLCEAGCRDHDQRDSREGQAKSDLGIAGLAYENTGAVEKKTKNVPMPALNPTV